MNRTCGAKLGEVILTLFLEMNEFPDPSIVIHHVSVDLVNEVSNVHLLLRLVRS